MTLEQIYKKSKITNPLYQKSTFIDFIQDFGNCGEDFFDSLEDYNKWIMKKENYISWYNFYKKYYIQ